MGILTPSRLKLVGVTGGDVLIETGTDGGMSLMQCSEIFHTIHTIELNLNSYNRGFRRLKKRHNITAHLGNSPEVLPKIIDSSRETVFFLDAHFVAGGVSVEGPQCPLMQELSVILGCKWRVPPVIIVDDARMFDEWFWSKPWSREYRKSEWPRLAEIQDFVGRHDYDVESIRGMLRIKVRQ